VRGSDSDCDGWSKVTASTISDISFPRFARNPLALLVAVHLAPPLRYAHRSISSSTADSNKSPINFADEGGSARFFSPIPPKSISPQNLPSVVQSNPSLANQWMEFTTDQGKYFHNFYTGKTSTNLTPAMSVVQAPVAMKKNQNLLRAKSEFMPRILRFRSWWQETKR